MGGEAGLGSFCAGNEELAGNQNPKPWQLGMLTQVYRACGGAGVVSRAFLQVISVTRQVFLIFFFPFFFPGFLLFKDYCMNEIDEAVPQLKFYEEVSADGGLGLCKG